MGRIYRQAKNGVVKRVEIVYSGEMAGSSTHMITNKLLQGLLEQTTDDIINVINAPHLASERGIKVVESKKSKSKYYTNLMELKVYDEQDQQYEIKGTLFGESGPRIVKLDRYRIDLIPGDFMLLINHHDQPGVIGQVGNILGNNSINIANMRVGRESTGGRAIMVLELDGSMPAQVLKEIRAVDAIEEARILEL